MNEYWLRQNVNQPLFPDILWSRPEHKKGAGKLLIVGGNSMGFAAVGEAYNQALKSGAGSVRAVLPDALRKSVGPVLEHCEFAPSTPSGSFAKMALNDVLINCSWADMVLLAGDIGRNSETAVLLEQFVQKYSGPLTVTKDVIDYFNAMPDLILNRENTALVLSLSQLQKLGIAVRYETPFLLSMGMLLLVQALHDFTLRYPVMIITKELDNIIVAHNGRVSSTKLLDDKEIWRVSTVASAAVFWLQNPNKPFEAATASLVG